MKTKYSSKRDPRNTSLGFRIVFLFEKLTDAYKWYGEGRIAEKNTIMGQEPCPKASFASSQAGALRYL